MSDKVSLSKSINIAADIVTTIDSCAVRLLQGMHSRQMDKNHICKWG